MSKEPANENTLPRKGKLQMLSLTKKFNETESPKPQLAREFDSPVSSLSEESHAKKTKEINAELRETY